jgi:two-component system sensor histidine kinase RpfC
LELRQLAGFAGAQRPCLLLTYAARRPAGRRDGVRCLPKPFLAETLVRAAEDLLGLAEPSDDITLVASGLGLDASRPAPGVRVLVAEDNAIAAKVITTFLTKMGFDHTHVEDGEQALHAALTERYGIAVVDLRMPKIDGIEFARRYRAVAPDHPMPIVALTANAAEDVKQTCLEAGMNDFLTKPVSPELLRQTVERWGLRDAPADAPWAASPPSVAASPQE